MKLKKILFVVNRDFLILDDPAFGMCVKLSQECNASIEALLVIDDSDIPGYGILSPKKNESVRRELINRAATYITTQLLNYPNAQIDIKIRSGVKFIEIIKESIEGNFDIIIKTQDIHHQRLHSLDLHLLRKTQTPIWILRNAAANPSNKLFAAIDLDLESTEEGSLLNDRIMETTKTISDQLELDITVISCWKLNGESAFRNSPFLKVSDLELEEMMTLESDRQAELMRGFLNKHGDFEHLLIKGQPVDAIANHVNISRPKALVMGTFARSGLSGYLIGNTAEDILLSIDSPVIALKPPGFISPVL